MSSSVIFVGSPQHYKKLEPTLSSYTKLVCVSPKDLLFRVIASFVPPFGKSYQKVYIDFLGPLIAVTFLSFFINYGYSFKYYKHGFEPITSIIGFSILMPLLCLFLTKLGQSTINLYETISLVGYALYGHILTLTTSFVLFDEKSNFFFFVCLIIFGGLSTLRLVLVFLRTIAVPGARLLICSTISLINMLFLIFLHFAFLHRTFVYNAGNY